MDLFLHVLPHSNQNRTENTAKTLKYPFSYTEYHYTKWRLRQTFERHNIQQRQRRTQRFREQKDRRRSVKVANMYTCTVIHLQF